MPTSTRVERQEQAPALRCLYCRRAKYPRGVEGTRFPTASYRVSGLLVYPLILFVAQKDSSPQGELAARPREGGLGHAIRGALRASNARPYEIILSNSAQRGIDGFAMIFRQRRRRPASRLSSRSAPILSGLSLSAGRCGHRPPTTEAGA